MDRILLEGELTGRVRAAWASLRNIDHEERAGFREHIAAVCEELLLSFHGKLPSEIPILAFARELYHSVGMDPTRLRPSSETLLRRVLQGKGLYRLDPVVDTGNLFSLSSGLPLGLYDLDSLQGDLVLRLGGAGEGYEGIRKGRVNVEGRLCLADAKGPFGSPTSDSQRCRVREDSNAVLFLLYAPESVDADWLTSQSLALEESFARWNGGMLKDRGILG